MFLLRRILIYVSSLLILVDLEMLFVYPKLWPLFLSILIIFPLVVLFVLNKFKFNFDLLKLSITPIFFLSGVFLFLLFLEQEFLKQGIIILTTILYFSLFDNYFLYLADSSKYQARTLENFSNYLNIASAFFIFSSVFSLNLFAFTSFRYLIALVAITALALTWQTLWINKISDYRNRFFIILLTLCLVEVYWALHYWPTSYLVNGLIMTIIFYAAVNLISHHLIDALSKKIAMRYLIISGIILLLTISTAQWT